MDYDLFIIGGGPAAVASAVYAGRKKLKTVLATESFGGQSIVSDDIQNWIGTKSISGFDLAKNFEEHVRAQTSVEVKMPVKVLEVKKIDGGYGVVMASGETYQTKTVIVASGGRRRRLGIPGEDKFDGKGLAFCSTCDAPLFSGKDVAVVGGGNAGLEAAIDLLPYAKKVYILEYGDQLKGDPITQAKVKDSSAITVIYHAQSKEVLGDKFVNGMTYIDKENNEEKKLDVGGVFVEIGSVPNSEMVKEIADINKRNEIVVDHQTGATSAQGVFAAGDVTDVLYKQNNISVGDGVKAALSAYGYLLKQ